MTDSSSVLKGVVAVIAGTLHASVNNHTYLTKEIRQIGGRVSRTVHSKCTHLIVDPMELWTLEYKQSPKFVAALLVPGLKVVSPWWVKECLKKEAWVDETPYLLPRPTSTPDAASGTADTSVNQGATTSRRSTRLAAAAAASEATPTGDSTQAKRALDDGSDGNANGKDDHDKGDDKTKEVQSDAESRLVKKLKLDDPKKKDDQKASSTALNLAPDDQSPFIKTHRIYVDDDGLIWDAALNQTNSKNNNNKFYIIQILQPLSGSKSMTLWCRWGRVGERGQNSQTTFNALDPATRAFILKFRSKSGLDWKNRNDPPKSGKYTFIEKNYEDSDDEEDDDAADESKSKGGKTGKDNDGSDVEHVPAESKLPPEVQEFVSLIFDQGHFQSTMAMMSYDANKLPLGKLSKRTLKNGFLLLKAIAEALAGGARTPSSLESLSNQYFSVIPHAFGRNRPPILNTTEMIQKEADLLDTLTDMEIATEIIKVASKIDDSVNLIDRQFAGLSLKEMTPLDHTSNEFIQLNDYLTGSRGQTHHISYKLKHAFRIEREGERERFLNSPYANLKNSDRRLLWHGSRTTNYGGILSQGLRIAPPEAPVNGYMFGKGVYFADVSTKSAGYCCSYSSASIGILLLCEVELGTPMYEPNGADSQAGSRAKAEGKIATLGRGSNVPKGWVDAGRVNESLKGVRMPDVSQGHEEGNPNFLYYNEYIVYDVAQIQQRYVLYVDMSM